MLQDTNTTLLHAVIFLWPIKTASHHSLFVFTSQLTNSTPSFFPSIAFHHFQRTTGRSSPPLPFTLHSLVVIICQPQSCLLHAQTKDGSRDEKAKGTGHTPKFLFHLYVHLPNNTHRLPLPHVDRHLAGLPRTNVHFLPCLTKSSSISLNASLPSTSNVWL